MIHIFTIPNWHPAALNQFVGKHWSTMHRMKKFDKQILWSHSIAIPKATGRRRADCKYILGKGQRARDPDAYQKSLGDALVYAKLLVDDSLKWVEWGNVSYERGDMATIITLTDIE